MSEEVEAKPTIVLGGEEIEVFNLSVPKIQAWRKAARPIVEAHDAVIELTKSATAEGNSEDIQAASRHLDNLVDDHATDMLNLVLDWLPDQARRDELAEKASMNEVLYNFLPLARRAYQASANFFGEMMFALSVNGLSESQTGTNSPEVSGESGQATSTS